jgi:hypothetical protein
MALVRWQQRSIQPSASFAEWRDRVWEVRSNMFFAVVIAYLISTSSRRACLGSRSGQQVGLCEPQGIIISGDITLLELSKRAELMLHHLVRPLIHKAWPPWAEARLPPPTSLIHGIDFAFPKASAAIDGSACKSRRGVLYASENHP